MKLLRRGVKSALFLILGVIVLFVCVLLALPTIVGSTWGKDTVCGLVASSLARSVECRGELSLTLGRELSLAVSDLHVIQPAGFPEGEMLSVGRVELTLPLVTSLFTHPTFDLIVVENVDVRIDSALGGQSNWSFGGGESAPAGEEEGTPSIVVPLIKRASIKSVSIRVTTPGKTARYSLEQLTVQGEDTGDGLLISGSGALDGVPLSLNGKVGSVSGLLAGDLTKVEVQALSAKHSVNANGEVNLKGSLDLDVSASGDSFSTFAAPLLSGLPGWSPYSIKFHAASSAPLQFTFSEISSKLGRVELTGEVALEKADRSPLDLKAKVVLPRHGVQVSGRLHKGGIVDLAVKGGMHDLTDLNDLFLTVLPRVPPFTLDGDARYLPATKGKASSLEIRKILLSIAESDVAGVGEVQLSPLSIKGSVTSKKINYPAVTRAFADVSPERASAHVVTPHTEAKTKKDLLPFESFSGIKLDLRVSLEEIVGFMGSAIRDLSTQISIVDGALTLSQFNGQAFKGTTEGEILLSPSQSTAKIKVLNLDAQHLSQSLGQAPFVEGTCNVSADLSFSGGTLDSILKSLAGTVELSSDHADFKSQALSVSASGLHRILSPLFKEGPSTPSDCILMNFTLKDGIARSNGNVVNLGDVFLFGQGEVNLLKNTISYSSNVNSTNPSLASLIPPFRVVGALGSPFFIPSTAGSVASVFDSAEGVFDTALGAVTSTARFILSSSGEKFEGRALCKEAIEVESRRMSTRVGRLFSSDSSAN